MISNLPPKDFSAPMKIVLSRSWLLGMAAVLPLLLATPARAQIPARQDVAVLHSGTPVRIDGRLDDPAWASATIIPLDYEWSPGENVPSPVRTECRVSFDDTNFYVSFRAYDPEPSQIRARYRDRDSGTSDDTVGFLIDTFNDGRRAYQFRINPLGVQLDAVNNDIDGSEDFSWDAIWESAGRIDEQGYVVEVAIPFSQLRFSRSSEPQTWGFLALRSYPRSLRHRMRSEYWDRSRACLVCQFGKLHGFEGITPGRNIELTPTLTAGRTDRLDETNGSLEKEEDSLDVGLSGRWSILPNVSLDAAINPDFSQVEADDAQLEINTRFALFFPEKRPFFLEGGDYFGTLLPAVFTRTVADPKLGIKLTGKEGISSGGSFYARDELNNLIFPGYDGSRLASIDQEVDSTVLRYRVDAGRGSNLGALYTGRTAEDYFNHVGGLDGTWRPISSETIRFQYLHSWTEYPESVATGFVQPLGEFEGNAGRIRYTHDSSNWFWAADYHEFSPRFRADSGFITRVNLRRGSVGLNRTLRAQDSWYSRLDFFVGSDWARSQDGDIEENGQDFSISYEGPKQMELSFTLSPNDEHFDGEDYDNTRISGYFEFEPNGDVETSLFANIGGTIDAANSREATFVTISPEIEWNLGRNLRGEIEHTFQELAVDDIRLFTANLTELSFLYNMSLRTFFRLILQYRNIDRNPDNYLFSVSSKSERLFTQWFFSYKLNANTAVLAGYSDTMNGSDMVDLTRDERSFFLKLGYTFTP